MCACACACVFASVYGRYWGEAQRASYTRIVLSVITILCHSHVFMKERRFFLEVVFLKSFVLNFVLYSVPCSMFFNVGSFFVEQFFFCWVLIF